MNQTATVTIPISQSVTMPMPDEVQLVSVDVVTELACGVEIPVTQSAGVELPSEQTATVIIDLASEDGGQAPVFSGHAIAVSGADVKVQWNTNVPLTSKATYRKLPAGVWTYTAEWAGFRYEHRRTLTGAFTEGTTWQWKPMGTDIGDNEYTGASKWFQIQGGAAVEIEEP